MSWKLNKKGVSHAKKLIDEGKYVIDSDWSDSQPGTSKENTYIKKEGWQAYSDWHLAYDPDKDEETKERYGFPYGDFKKVHRSGLNAIQQRAGQYDYEDILKAGDDLVKKIDKKKELMNFHKFKLDCSQITVNVPNMSGLTDEFPPAHFSIAETM